jgi:hypothetical protein
MVDPEGLDYYQSWTSAFGAFCVPAAELSVGFAEALRYEPDANPAAAILFTSGVLCVAGFSRRWGVWGSDRESWLSYAHWFVRPGFRDMEASAAFTDRFVRNFGSGGGHDESEGGRADVADGDRSR